MTYRLRFIPGTDAACQRPHLRYPRTGCTTREQAEVMRAAMPEPDAFEIVWED